MSTMKKYMDIPRLGHKTTTDYFIETASKGHDILIGLKLDGSNGQFEVDKNGELAVFSRNNPLDEENNLRGFYQYAKGKVDPALLPKGFKVFGEWLTSHTVQYPQEMYNHFYIFSVYDSTKEEYISPKSNTYKNIVEYLTKHCGMKTEIVLYEGPYKGMAHIEEIVNKVTRDSDEYTNQKPETIDDVFHEGVVIKAHDYRDRYGHQLFVKIVGKKFQETKKVKLQPKKDKGPDTSVEGQIVEFAVTEARIEKMLNKLVDEGILPEEYDLENMQTIAKNLPKRIHEDIMKEELDTIQDEFGEFDPKLIGKKLNGRVMTFAKMIINKKVEERVRNL